MRNQIMMILILILIFTGTLNLVNAEVNIPDVHAPLAICESSHLETCKCPEGWEYNKSAEICVRVPACDVYSGTCECNNPNWMYDRKTGECTTRLLHCGESMEDCFCSDYIVKSGSKYYCKILSK